MCGTPLAGVVGVLGVLAIADIFCGGGMALANALAAPTSTLARGSCLGHFTRSGSSKASARNLMCQLTSATEVLKNGLHAIPSTGGTKNYPF